MKLIKPLLSLILILSLTSICKAQKNTTENLPATVETTSVSAIDSNKQTIVQETKPVDPVRELEEVDAIKDGTIENEVFALFSERNEPIKPQNLHTVLIPVKEIVLEPIAEPEIPELKIERLKPN